MPIKALGLGLVLVALLCGQGCSSAAPPDPSELLLTKARTAWLAGDYDQAATEYGRYLQDYPTAPQRLEAWQRLADIAGNVRADPAEAARILETAMLEIDQDAAELGGLGLEAAKDRLLAKQPDRAIRLYKTILAGTNISPPQRLDGMLQLAQAFVMEHDMKSAMATLNQCRQSQFSDAQTSPCTLGLASLAAASGDTDQAQTLWQTVFTNADVAPRYKAIAGFALGELAEARRDKETARTYFEAIRDIYPNPTVITTKLELLKK